MSLFALGALGALTGCADQSSADGDMTTAPQLGKATNLPTPPPITPSANAPSPSQSSSLARFQPGPSLPGIPDAHPGLPRTLFFSPQKKTNQIALTIDDGYNSEVVSAYIEFAQRSKLPITFSPNGCYQAKWKPHAAQLRPMIESGQVQIGNHTFTHKDMRHETDAAVAHDISHNELWVQSTFGCTSRPYLRPPYGAHDARTDAIAGDLGFTHILMWNGTFGDSSLISPRTLMTLARRYLQPRTVLLGHANHPTITGLFDQITELIAARHLEPVTVDQMFGTSRSIG